MERPLPTRPAGGHRRRRRRRPGAASTSRQAPPRLPLTATPNQLTTSTAASITTLAESTMQSMVTRGEFPAPRELSGRRVGYLYSEIMDWALSRPRSELLPPKNTGARKSKVAEAS
ncbi:helix-turn-helix transcriptional regulator [Achromobacter ruhlandii]|uniref:helix-turn-helix transcriptional regulator n=1 Tax=Achromobacter ruhlandii TaxID=72557 RepID=UPI0009ECD788|nr:AlpA family phage regulatory protein [Achromobacter ruhlandii]